MSNDKFYNFLIGLSAATEALDKLISPKEEKESNETPVILTADKLREIRWMTERQIDLIYQHGKKPVKIEDTPAAYRELRWMTTGQLECLFGRSDI